MANCCLHDLIFGLEEMGSGGNVMPEWGKEEFEDQILEVLFWGVVEVLSLQDILEIRRVNVSWDMQDRPMVL